MESADESTRCEFMKRIVAADMPSPGLFSLLDKHLVSSGAWAKLLPTARSIWPVISRHFNSTGQCFPGRETISRLSGVAVGQVSVATQNLVEHGLMRITKGKLSARGQRSNVYHATSTPSWRNSVFIFHSIIDGLHWARLTDSARGLYITMRAFGFINYEHVVGLSQECYDITDDDDIADEVMRWQEFTADHFRAEFYPARPFELCIADEDALMELSGIKDRRTFRRAIRTLENGRLIESLGDFVDGDHTWAVAVCGVLPSREECLAA